MIFEPAPIPGAFVIELDRLPDERGFFARTFCREEFTHHGLEPVVAQSSLSFNKERGTLRGMHYQAEPHSEAKVVRVTAGAIWDVILDLRADSASYLRSFGKELSARNRTALYAPPGVAHGFLTLEPNTEVHYQMSAPYEPTAARGVRWDDPAFGISWPQEPRSISERDRDYPNFGEERP